MKLKYKISIIFTIIIFIFSFIILYSSYKKYKYDFLKKLRKEAKSIAFLSAKNIPVDNCKKILKNVNIDYNDYDNLNAEKDYLIDKNKIFNIEMSDYFQEIVEKLNTIRNLKSNTILYAYILIPTKNPNTARFLSDADLPIRTLKKEIIQKEKEELVAHLTKKYDISKQPSTKLALNEKKLVVSKNFTYDKEYDANSIMAFAPITDENNNYIATLGLDFSDKKVTALINKNIKNSILLIIALTIIFSFLIYISGNLLTNPLKKITTAAQKIGNKNFNINLNEGRDDEIGILSKNFNNMANQIHKYQKKLKNLNNQLKIEKEELAVTLKSIGDGVITTDMDGKIKMLNTVAEELTGWNSKNAKGKDFEKVFNIINSRTRKKADNPIQKVINTGRIVGLANNTSLISKDKKEYIIADSAAPIYNSENNIIGVVIVFRDITKTEKLQDRIESKQKIESLELLSGGIAHDFNNYLTGILGNISLVKSNIENKSLIKKLEKAENAAVSAKSLTNQLLFFSKKNDSTKKIINLKELLKETINFSLINSNRNSEIIINKNLNNIKADPGQIKQVINNLIINSIQATHNDDYIKITAENINLMKNNIFPKLKRDFVKITIEDNGPGIPENNLDRIFDPFYTTKNQGTGLGLSTCLSIIKKHDGYITVDSQKDKFTKFYIYLPAVKDEIASENVTVKFNVKNKKLLILDENKITREVLKDIFNYLKCDVETTRTKEKLIELYNKSHKINDPFDVIIIDYNKNNKYKIESIFKKLKLDNNDIKIIISSSFPKHKIKEKFKRYGISNFIEKPYRIKLIKRTLTKLFSSNN